jgi:uncharacterized protein (TIGR00369 family)
MAEKQPGSKTCFVCGRENPVGLKMNFYSTGEGSTQAEITIPVEYEGYPGVVHGGIVAAILDETGGRALMENFTRFMVTAQLNVRYRKPVPSQTALIVIGEAGVRRGRVAHAKSEIKTQVGDVLASAELVLVDLPESQLAALDAEVLGWRVYPDEEAG